MLTLMLLQEAGGNQSLIIGTVGTVAGGIGAVFLERMFSRKDKKVDEAAKIRDEIWTELNNQRARLATVEKELDEWKEKYFRLYGENVELHKHKIRLEGVIDRMRAICSACPYNPDGLVQLEGGKEVI